MEKAVITWDMEQSFCDQLSNELYNDGITVVQTGKDRDIIYDSVKDADFIFAGLADKEIMMRAPNLKMVQALTSSVGRIDLRYAASIGVPICSAKGHNAVAVAEHTLMLMLMLARKSNTKHHIDSYEIEELSGKTVCVLGVGCIGSEVGKRCYNMGMRVLGIDMYPHNYPYFESIEYVDKLAEFVRKSDFLTIHVPRTSQTKGMINKYLFESSKSSLYIVDVSRGEITDVDDLYHALSNHKIKGAAMDVFPDVFYPGDSPQSHPIFELENFIYTPHTAGKSAESRKNLAKFAANNVCIYLSGKTPMNVVDPNVGF
ncbi:hypothetical protein HYZ41_03675 [archaeon]|nr:hypothetical protein [archaeon]